MRSEQQEQEHKQLVRIAMDAMERSRRSAAHGRTRTLTMSSGSYLTSKCFGSYFMYDEFFVVVAPLVEPSFIMESHRSFSAGSWGWSGTNRRSEEVGDSAEGAPCSALQCGPRHPPWRASAAVLCAAPAAAAKGHH